MRIDEVWMRLESLKHLRDMPQLKRLKDNIEAELMEIQKGISPPDKAPEPVTVEPVEDIDEPDHVHEPERRI